MNSERWRRIEEAYYSVLAVPRARRVAVLDKACSNDMELRREVESLLDARNHAGSFLSAAERDAYITELASEPDLAAGDTLAQYAILSGLGHGAMGEVYLARDTKLDRQVALKILPPRFTRDLARVARFRREAKAASALNHPNIITIFEIGESGEIWFIAAEFVQGITLRERLARGKLDLQEVLAIGIQCATALSAVHRAGIVHRDIKPENLMIRPDGFVKIVDFGLARIREPESAVDTTHAGALMGTPRYMSPEQARGQTLDSRTDIFSLGAVLYELATEQPAFGGATTAEVFAGLLASVPRPPSRYVKQLPAAFDKIVARALASDLGSRYQSMQELAKDLEAVKRKPASRTSIIAVQQTQLGISNPRSPIRLLALLLSAAIAVVALALAAYMWRARPRKFEIVRSLGIIPLTSFTGYKDFGTFSPTGSQIAFSWNGGNGGSGGKQERNIYTKAMGPVEPVQLTFGSKDDRLPAWSPDGRYIAFCRSLSAEPVSTQFAIIVVPSSGGQERRITEAGPGVSWSADGSELAVSGLPSGPKGISMVSLATGQQHALTHPDPNIDSLPAFSPDGRWLAFTRDFGYASRELFVIPASGGTPRQLTFDHQPTYGAAWTADSREIVFSSHRGIGGESLWRISLADAVPKRLSATLQGGFYPSISRQGDQLVYTESLQDTNIFASAGKGFNGQSALARFGPSERLITSSRRDDSPSISADGQRVAFVSKRTGNEEIWICDRKGGRNLQLTSFKGPATGTPRWSPDGRSIVFDSLAAGNPDIYVVDSGGGTPRRLTHGPSGNFMPSWSADGKAIIFKSNRSGSDQLWKIPAIGGTPVQITRNGACEGFASPDGKLVYYTKHAWGGIWQVPLEGGPEQPVPQLQTFNRIFRSWGVLDQGIYFMSREDMPRQNVRFFSFSTHQVTSLLALDHEPIWDYPDLTISSDGRQMLVACLDQEVNDLMLIENFN